MLRKIVSIFVLGLLSACGFHFQNGLLIPTELQTLALESDDIYSDVAVAVRRQLQLNNIEITEDRNVPILRINGSRRADDVASVFRTGREAEKLLALNIDAVVIFPDHERYEITAKVSRTFFDNSRAALAKSAEKEVIWNDMHDQAARQLITKIIALKHKIER